MSFQDYVEDLGSKAHMGDLNRSTLIGIIVIMVIAILFIIFNLVGSPSSEEVSIDVAEAADLQNDEVTENPDGTNEICVHVVGCVNEPGIYYLSEGSRIADAIEAAGGMTEDAHASYLNLAEMLEDASQIDVLSKSEYDLMVKQGSEDVSNRGYEGVPATRDDANGKININTASPSELQKLSGIGESKAKKIVEYRDKNGLFKSVDELTKVSGIGDKTLESIRESICI